ncbi:MAG: LamG-like jellyroll fold domain-containing protein [Acidobacteriota bacterium]
MSQRRRACALGIRNLNLDAGGDLVADSQGTPVASQEGWEATNLLLPELQQGWRSTGTGDASTTLSRRFAELEPVGALGLHGTSLPEGGAWRGVADDRWDAKPAAWLADAGDYLESGTVLPSGAQWTYEALMRFEAYDASVTACDIAYLTADGTTASTSVEWRLRVSDAGQLQAIVHRRSASAATATRTGPINTGRWHWVAVRADKDGVSLWVDGSQVGESAITFPSAPAVPLQLVVGRSAACGVAMVRHWSAALPDSWMADPHLEVIRTARAGLELQWALESPDDLSDTSGLGRNAALVGAVEWLELRNPLPRWDTGARTMRGPWAHRQAVQFDGRAAYASAAGVAHTRDTSVELWLRVPEGAPDDGGLPVIALSGAWDLSLETGALKAESVGGGTVYSGAGIADDGLWHHVLMTIDGYEQGLALYVDGQFQGADSSAAWAAGTGVLSIAGDGTAFAAVEVRGDVCIWDRVVEVSESSWHRWRRRYRRAIGGLRHHYRFDAAEAGGPLIDRAGDADLAVSGLVAWRRSSYEEPVTPGLEEPDLARQHAPHEELPSAAYARRQEAPVMAKYVRIELYAAGEDYVQVNTLGIWSTLHPEMGRPDGGTTAMAVPRQARLARGTPVVEDGAPRERGGVDLAFATEAEAVLIRHHLDRLRQRPVLIFTHQDTPEREARLVEFAVYGLAVDRGEAKDRTFRGASYARRILVEGIPPPALSTPS